MMEFYLLRESSQPLTQYQPVRITLTCHLSMESLANEESGALTSRCVLTLNHFSLVTHPEWTQSPLPGGGIRWRAYQEFSSGPLTTCCTKLTSHASSHCPRGCPNLPVLAGCLGSNGCFFGICTLPGLDRVAGVYPLSPKGSNLLLSLPSSKSVFSKQRYLWGFCFRALCKYPSC